MKALRPAMTPEVKLAAIEMVKIQQLRGVKTRKMAEAALYTKVGGKVYEAARLALTLKGWFKTQVMGDEAACLRQEKIAGIKVAPEMVDYHRMDVMYDAEPLVGADIDSICEELVI